MERTYISLFSCAGVGCYGFKMNGFQCVASNELLEPRIEVQKANHKCKYESGYICADATDPKTHKLILDEISLWKQKEGLEQVDVVFATPPCQGMSTANYKKNDHEQIRNSLVVEAIKMIKQIHPKIFIFENVRAFLKSICTDISGKDMVIQDCIVKHLSEEYNIYWKVINFKDYGVPSSRPRTIVIGTSKNLKQVTPLHLFPTRQNEILLKDSIGYLPRLNYCEKDTKDPFHFARPFPEYMLAWIRDLKEGETAFDNPDETKPCTFDKNGNRIINKGAYMGNKYRRLIWNKPGACIATRSDVMSSQDTIHPCDNRVLSIRELMILMTIPKTFKWTNHDSALTVDNSDEYLKENEGNIRRCIGEAVPTQIGNDIARKIKKQLECEEQSFNLSTCDLQTAYNEVLKLPDDIKNVKIKVDTIENFKTFFPMLSSYYSHLDSVILDLNVNSEAEEKEVEKFLKQSFVGSNMHINLNAKSSRSRFYDIVVSNGHCNSVLPTNVKEDNDWQLF